MNEKRKYIMGNVNKEKENPERTGHAVNIYPFHHSRYALFFPLSLSLNNNEEDLWMEKKWNWMTASVHI